MPHFIGFFFSPFTGISVIDESSYEILFVKDCNAHLGGVLIVVLFFCLCHRNEYGEESQV
jgi:hypothetical protein